MPRSLPDGAYDQPLDAAHFRPLLERVLESVHGEDDADKQRRRIEILNRSSATSPRPPASTCGAAPLDPGETLVQEAAPPRGSSPFSALQVNAKGEPALGPDATLRKFLAEADLTPQDLYANDRSFTALHERAFGTPELTKEERDLHARLRALTHVADDERLGFLRAVASDGPLPAPASPRAERLQMMTAAALLDCRKAEEARAVLEEARAHPPFRAELGQLIEVLEDQRREVTVPWQDPHRIRPVPLHIHARYRQEEVLAAMGAGNGSIPRLQAGVFYVEPENVDLLFVTLTPSAHPASTGSRRTPRTRARRPGAATWRSRARCSSSCASTASRATASPSRTGSWAR